LPPLLRLAPSATAASTFRPPRDCSRSPSGLLAVAVLLVVMIWFFHEIYWTGWISAHNRVRRRTATA